LAQATKSIARTLGEAPQENLSNRESRRIQVKFSGSFSKDKVQEQQIENMINGLQCYFATDEHGCDALRDQLEEARYVPPPLKDAVNKTVNGMTGYLENRKSAERLREWETYCEGDDNDPECKKFHDAEVSGPTLSAHDANQETLGPSNLGEHSDAAKGQSDAPSSTSSPYDCAVLDDETQSRQLMTEDQQKWLDLIGRCKH
jgi:hypothetical protein